MSSSNQQEDVLLRPVLSFSRPYLSHKSNLINLLIEIAIQPEALSS